jgi:phosphoribosylanthranilate isomerase
MVKVKVCGLTNLRDALAAVASGADLLGFIFFPGSPRYVAPERVRAILTAVRDQQPDIQAVGVFVNEALDAVCQVLDYCGLQLAQLHGEEPPEMLGLDESRRSPLRGRAYKALRPRTLEEAHHLAARYALPVLLHGENGPPAFLLDTWCATQRGGTGQACDWGIAAHLAGQYSVMLAGGLSPANVAQAVRQVRPWGVDAASGIECAPGQKDHAAMRAFISSVVASGGGVSSL